MHIWKLKRAVSLLLAVSFLSGALPPVNAVMAATPDAGKTHAGRMRAAADAGSTQTGADEAASPEAGGASPENAKESPEAGGASVENAEESPEESKQGLQFRLSEGAEQPEAQASNRLAAATPLSESATQNVLKRLPPLKSEADDRQGFALRERSLPPPRTGQVVNNAFPPPAQPAVPASNTTTATLEVLRFSPEGEVPLAPQLSVTFSQPMVSLTSLAELAAQSVPVELTPQPKGRWRWLGTRTLLFDPEGRLPMATRYTATVRAGTKSATGATLTETKTWSFATPAPKLLTSYPTGTSVRRDALIFLGFDQRVEPEAVRRNVRVRAGAQEFATRLATPEELAADAGARALAKSAEPGRWLALRVLGGTPDGTNAAAGSGASSRAAAASTASPLPGNATVSVVVGIGTPSAEGARTTDKTQSFSFRTYGALKLLSSECGNEKKCTPVDAWRITFSNPLDAEAFENSQVRIEPEIPGVKLQVYGDTLNVEGWKRGRTTYRVTIDASLRDVFGQTLGAPSSVTFNVGAADPSIGAQGEGLVVLDPSAPPQFSVFTVNHPTLRVSLYAVTPEHWSRFGDFMRYVSGYGDEASEKQRTPPGKLVQQRDVKVAAAPDELVETRIDLRPALEAGSSFGHVVVRVETNTSGARRRGERESVQAWVELTEIGLDAFVDRTDLVGWTTALRDGKPLAGVELSIYPTEARATTGADGLARIPLPPAPTAEAPRLLLARRGRDVALLPEHMNWWSKESGWFKQGANDALRWYVFDDRQMYRPGEEVHVKGWLRRAGGDKLGDVGALGGTPDRVAYSLTDARGNEITKGVLKLNAFGGFDTSLKLPPTVNLGYTSLELSAQGGAPDLENSTYTHRLQVQEFRRPEFEVSTTVDAGPHFVRGQADATVSAAYYASGGLAGADVNWTVNAAPGNFTPPNRGDYTFGTWEPWWRPSYATRGRTQTQSFKGRTDASGKHRLHVDFDSVAPPRPSSVTVSASVTDVNRQTWSDSKTLLVHPADLYVGLRSERTFVERGEPIEVQAIVTDLDGRAIAGRDVRLRAVLLDWVFKKGTWQQEETNAQECSVKSAADAVKCRFETKQGGVYRVRARILDDRERPNESELTLWVAGGKTPPSRNVAQETVELIPDRKEYHAGETAQLLVRAPFFPAEGVLTLRRSGIIRTERFHMDSASHTLRIPIEERFTPNLFAQVDLVGSAPRADASGQPDAKLPARPAFGSGQLDLSIPPLSRKLLVTTTPHEKALEPGATTTVDVEVRDASNHPVEGSELALVVVDEAVLALTRYSLPDPLDIFYTRRDPGTTDFHLRGSVQLVNPDDLQPFRRNMMVSELATTTVTVMGSGRGGASRVLRRSDSLSRAKAMELPVMQAAAPPALDGVNDEAAESIRLRENFNALAVFAPSVLTDARGHAQVEVKLPDNLTRYRVMAVSVAGGRQFGTGESAITARMPLMVRPSAPRFLNFGDRFELPVVVQNQTDAPLSVDVAVRASNLELTEGAGRRVSVPANDRVEVRFPASANEVGTARFQAGALSGRFSDAAEIQLPVWTPATTEAFATYGELDAGAVTQPVKAPSGVFKQFGGLDISTSSTELQSLTDAVIYLTNYPYECSEQLASRVLGIAALRDVLTAFKAEEMPKPAEMLAAVERDLKRLKLLQNEDGGFAFWRRGDQSWPYLSIHVAHALARAREKKFNVPDDMLDKSRNYLRNIERHIPATYSPDCRRALIAYALYVRNRMGDRDAARAARLISEAGLENLSLEAVGWLLPVLSETKPGAPLPPESKTSAQVLAIRRLLANRAVETAATAHFTTSYTDGEYLLLHSERRADAIILEALIGDQPTSDLIPKLVRGLLAHRVKGRWLNTQENVFALLALDRYFQVFERTTPNFTARAWLGERLAGEQQFQGRSTDRQQISIPMSYLAGKPEAQQTVVIAKEGAGRLYYRLGMQYAPTSLRLDAADYGFTVERVYEGVDDAADVRRDADGTWHVKAGARVRVRLTLAAPSRRYHVALVDPLPAGLEALNPSLAVTETVPADNRELTPARERAAWWWYRTWFEHQNFRDERTEAFTTLLREGVYTYSYVARATTPGLFVVPPPKAEEMYHPETFGRGATDRVRVE